jgi:hypothetical protein
MPQSSGDRSYRAAALLAAYDDQLGGASEQVDASDDSFPIVQRLGFVAVTTTTPYVYAPVT